jgi:hypothetical protein
MILSQLNYLAVLVSGIAYFMLGMLWFNPKTFGTAWAKGHNIPTDRPDRSGMMKMMGMTFVTAVIIALFCGYFMMALGITSAMSAIKIGAILGLGFSVMTQYINSLYIKLPLNIVLIDSGYHVFGIIISCVIMALWR